MIKFSGVILAGGQSYRMGRDKSRLVLQGETLVARAIRLLGSLADDLILVAAAPDPPAGPDVRLTADVIPGGGALSGIHAGLLAARHDWALVVACDMPFLNLDLLRYMAGLAPGHSVVAPRWHGEIEALHTLYARDCLPVIEPILRRGGGRIRDFYGRVKTRYVEPGEIARLDPDGLSFFNVNSPQDWERAQALVALP